MHELAGRTTLITGASGAVGRACVEALVGSGANVMLSDQVEPPRELLARPNVAFEAADVTDQRSMDRLCAATAARFGGLHSAILAAGVEGPVGAAEDIAAEEIDSVLAVNVKGCLYAMQACLRHMKSNGCGSIVAISSISGVVGTPSMACYSISKHAVIGLVRSVALESGRHQVRINAVCPGPVESDMMHRIDRAFLAREPDRFGGSAKAAMALPLQRYVTAAEVAQFAAFLCSDRAGSCHGGVYMVDGGFTAK